jgi:cell division protein FtsI (penicillin-binding protein 3)
VTLSINKELQGIAEWALSEAVKSHAAMDGDIVIVSPQSGEILAMASYGKDAGFATTAMVAAPFEPGSSLKPLLAARILELQRASPDEVVETTELEIPGWDKPLSDDHPAPTRSFHEVIKHSSNVGMVQFAWRLSAREHYEALRDFGLGMPTGVSLPGEASGRLDPIGWTQATQASAAMGYGVSVTSLQLAMAYASIANGGELLTPSLVKEIRDPQGNILFRHTRRVVRRVMSPQVAAQMRLMLRDVVQGGTALAADIELGELAGKTGTSRYAGANGYERGKHIATFAGMFPARDPQYVIVVRLVDPDGTYGGTTAAPVTAAVLRAAAVAQDALLDQRTISATASRGAEESGTAVAAAGFAALSPDESEPNGSDDADEGQLQARARVIDLAGGAQGLRESSMLRPVPRVAGLPLRDAVFLLHRAGFKVKVSRGSPGSSAGNGGSRNGGGGTGAVSAVAQNGEAVATAPAAGSARKRGDLILLYSGQ